MPAEGAGPLGGDWVSGERVFGPPVGTFDADWLVPVVREAVPEASHERAREAVVGVWAVLREEAAHRGCAPADVPADVVASRLGLSSGPAGAAPDRVDEAALTAVRAAVRAYGAR
ncbi:hypothetical protein [Quadrisphaera sp. KR29]|uniref:hypothetical protein n=1 Tax=Quadrisphaera sp. KR29 TaxID=3461391 RepID=UPI00404428F3